MTKVILWCAFGGAAVGLVTMGAEAALAHFDPYERFPLNREPHTQVVSLQGQEVIDADTEEKLYALAVSKQKKQRNPLRLPWWSYPAIGAAAGVVVVAPFARAGCA